MSINIIVINQNAELIMAADKRAIKNGVISDDYNKIYKINDQLYYLMAGIAEYGLFMLNKINKYKNLDIDALINFTDQNFKSSLNKLTITLCGKKNNDYFIWQKNNEGKINNPNVSDKKIIYALATNNKIQDFVKIFHGTLTESGDIVKAIDTTILYASNVDHTISQQYDLIKVKL